MDYVEFCGQVLADVVQVTARDYGAGLQGADYDKVLEAIELRLFGEQGRAPSTLQEGLKTILPDLEEAGLLSRSGSLNKYFVTSFGDAYLLEPRASWQIGRNITVNADVREYLTVINELSSHQEQDHGWVDSVTSAVILLRLPWTGDGNRLHALEQKVRQVRLASLSRAATSGPADARSTLRGLVWQKAEMPQ